MFKAMSKIITATRMTGNPMMKPITDTEQSNLDWSRPKSGDFYQ